MKLKTIKVFGLLAACSLAAGWAQAQDTALLNTLVQKGYLTTEEASQIAATSSGIIHPAGAHTRSLKFSGRVQTQFNWVTGDDKQPNAVDPAATTSFQARRIFLGAIAELGEGWRGTVIANFANAGTNYLDQANISKAFDGNILQGRMTAGLRKVRFGYEEYSSSAELPTIERSIATRYWADGFQANGRLGFASRHVGVYWDGKVPDIDGLYYGGSISNSAQSSIGGQAQNDLAYFVYSGYKSSYEDLYFDFGLNFGYKPGGNTATSTPGVSKSIISYNPYLKLDWKGLSVLTELLGGEVEEGRVATTGRSNASPIGFSVTPSYMITDEYQVVFSYSHLQTNGRGVLPNAVVPGAPNPVGGRSFNRADAFYIGGSWFIVGNDVKLSAGYEWIQFENPVNSPAVQGRYNVSAFRTRLQLLF